MAKSYNKYIFPIILLMGFVLYFAYDIYTLRKCFTIPDYLSYYYPFRQWFSQRLVNGEFPIWNPFWGLGHIAEISSTIPIDMYTILEVVFGPQYHYFQTVQLALILFAGFYAFIKLGYKPLVSTVGTILYFMTPLVTYWYHFFWTGHAFIGNMLLFVFIYLWFKTENHKYLFFITWTVIFSMFGTKIEFLFFNITMCVFYSFAAAVIFYSHKFSHSVKIFFLAVLSIFVGVLAHLWQLNILFRAVNLSNRMGDFSISNLFSCEMYRNFYASIYGSPLIKILIVMFCFYRCTYIKRWFSLIYLLLGIIAVFVLDIFKFNMGGTILTIRTPLLKNPEIVGAICGFLLSLLSYRFSFSLKPIFSIKNFRLVIKFFYEQIKTTILFLLFIYYWLRPPHGPEMGYESLAPVAFKILLATLVWLGCTQFWKSKLVKLAYFSMLFVFLMREHGQILLAYLGGIVWIPSRDNYIIDFAVAVLAVRGLAVLDISAIFGPQLRWYNRISAVSLIAIGIIVFSASSNFYYSQPMMKKTPADYLYYFGTTKVRKAIHALKDSPVTRFFIVNKPTISFSFGFDACLMEGVNQVTHYAGLVSKNYVDWALYKRLGIKPKGKWIGAWTGELGEEIASRLPKRDTYGYSNTDLYILTVIVRPPLEKDTLKLLGTKYLLVFTKSLSDPAVGYYDFKNPEYLNTKLKELSSKKIEDSDDFFYTARLNNPLPRAFLVDGVSNANINEFMNEMDPVITDKNDIIKTKSFEFLVKDSARIEKYKPENVSITVDAKEGAYLVLSDLYHPFWHAKLDGRDTKIIPAFYILRAVKVPAGKHRVDFYCRVPYFGASIAISLLIIISSIVLFFTVKHFRSFADSNLS